MHTSIVVIGLESIGHGIGAESRTVFQTQIGTTRIGGGGSMMIALPAHQSKGGGLAPPGGSGPWVARSPGGGAPPGPPSVARSGKD